ncbi:MAG: hypothetical protein JWM26_2024 [Betaproteobacteria bacterium]|nr:hypothetical protein [Betaproteobacteria bacterium]
MDGRPEPQREQAQLFSALLESLRALNSLATPLAILSSLVPPKDAAAFNKGMDEYQARMTTALAELERYANG